MVHTFNYIKGDKIDQMGTSSVRNLDGDMVMVNYNGTDNVYVVSTSITASKESSPMTADVVKKGSDFTKYLDTGSKVGASSSVTSAVLSASYAVFKNTTLNSVQLETDPSNGNIYTPDKEAYIYDTETKNIIHLKANENLGAYVDHVDGADDKTFTMKERYRLLYNVNDKAGIAGTLGEPTTVENLSNKDFIGAVSENQLYDTDGKAVSGMALYKYFNENGDYTGGLYTDKDATKKIIDNGETTSSVYYGKYISNLTEKVTAALTFSVHAGADSDLNNRISAKIDTMSAAGLGVNRLKSTSIGIVDETGDNAREAIDVIGDALKIVSTQRSILGAVQNRLEHTIANLDNVVENTTAAESAIRDTDMADEMVKFSNNQVLLQAGQSILAQANQSNQGVLSLLQ